MSLPGTWLNLFRQLYFPVAVFFMLSTIFIPELFTLSTELITSHITKHIAHRTPHTAHSTQHTALSTIKIALRPHYSIHYLTLIQIKIVVLAGK